MVCRDDHVRRAELPDEQPHERAQLPDGLPAGTEDVVFRGRLVSYGVDAVVIQVHQRGVTHCRTSFLTAKLEKRGRLKSGSMRAGAVSPKERLDDLTALLGASRGLAVYDDGKRAADGSRRLAKAIGRVGEKRGHPALGYGREGRLHGRELRAALRLALESLGQFRADLKAQRVGDDDPNALALAEKPIDLREVEARLLGHTRNMPALAQVIGRGCLPRAAEPAEEPSAVDALKPPGELVNRLLARAALHSQRGVCLVEASVCAVHLVPLACIGVPHLARCRPRKPLSVRVLKAAHFDRGENRLVACREALSPDSRTPELYETGDLLAVALVRKFVSNPANQGLVGKGEGAHAGKLPVRLRGKALLKTPGNLRRPRGVP